MTEKEKMLQGKWYDANFDQELLQKRLEAEELCFEFNQTRPKDIKKKNELLKKLLPHMQEECTILSPLYVDYGYYTSIGKSTFINHNAYLMDGGGISIGHHCFIGPNCGMYTAIHALDSKQRNDGIEKALPIKIGNNCWIGADVTILPGVCIGDNTVIGAKSVVTKDIPSNVVAVGNPCKVQRQITEKDKTQLD